MRNKDQKKKCKGQESTIGKIIYGFLLFLPLLAISTTCLVQTFNQNAKQQEEAQLNITYKYQTNEVNSVDDLVVGNIYHFKLENELFDDVFGFDEGSSILLNFINIKSYNIPTTIELADSIFSSWSNEKGILCFTFYIEEYDTYFDIYANYNLINDYFLDYYLENGTFQTQLSIEGDFILQDINNLTYINNGYITASTYNEIESVELEQEPLDENVFYRAVDRVTQSPLFNWAQNSIIYTTTNATCNALSITTPFIPLLMSYWLIISVIYFLYDIALMLVWIIHRKIHELQESI